MNTAVGVYVGLFAFQMLALLAAGAIHEVTGRDIGGWFFCGLMGAWAITLVVMVIVDPANALPPA